MNAFFVAPSGAVLLLLAASVNVDADGAFSEI
jgi:hypothetical protein